MLEYENESAIPEPFDLKAVAEAVMEASLDAAGCPYEAVVSLLVTGDDEIREINEEQRGIDSVTDVLSFPVLSFDKPGDFSFLETKEADGSVFEPDSGFLMLGDMVIDFERCIRQAGEYGHSVLREFAFLVAHSMLHLTGYDHMTPHEEEEMCSLQETILNRLGITRDFPGLVKKEQMITEEDE